MGPEKERTVCWQYCVERRKGGVKKKGVWEAAEGGRKKRAKLRGTSKGDREIWAPFFHR
jgi:hypothetical protein